MSKQITQIKKRNNYSFDFYIDNEYAFFLSKRELTELNLYDALKDVLDDEEEISVSLPDNVFDMINEQLIIPRGIGYALNLLAARDYTKKQITDKICTYGYNEVHALKIIERIIELGFINDKRYALSYIRMHYEHKSKKYIKGMLFKKGISSEIMEEAFLEYADELSCLGTDEAEISRKTIYKILSKKYDSDHFGELDGLEMRKELNKIIASLMRKGFPYNDIRYSVSKYFNLNSLE